MDANASTATSSKIHLRGRRANKSSNELHEPEPQDSNSNVASNFLAKLKLHLKLLLGKVKAGRDSTCQCQTNNVDLFDDTKWSLTDPLYLAWFSK